MADQNPPEMMMPYVPLYLRRPTNNHRAAAIYDPQFVALGPLHLDRSRSPFNEAEKFKRVCLTRLTGGDERVRLDLHASLRRRSAEIRALYPPAALEGIDDEDLATIMLFDGAFLIELMSICTRAQGSNLDLDLDSDSLSMMLRDVYLVENQIPLVVLEELCPNSSLLIRDFVKWTTKADEIGSDVPSVHLLEKLKRCLTGTKIDEADWFRDFLNPTNRMPPYIRSVHDMLSEGISFAPSSFALSDISFSSIDGCLWLPIFSVGTHTSAMLTNLIAYEVSKYSGGAVMSTVAYVLFMKCLLHTPDDVRYLVENGILQSSLPNHSDVVDLFSSIDTLGYGIMDLSGPVWSEINVFCEQSVTNVCVGGFVINDFIDPWKGLALLFVVIVLFCSMVEAFGMEQ